MKKKKKAIFQMNYNNKTNKIPIVKLKKLRKIKIFIAKIT